MKLEFPTYYAKKRNVTKIVGTADKIMGTVHLIVGTAYRNNGNK